MNAEQLIQQYESGGDARLFVTGVWEGISEDMNESHILDTYPILLRFWTTEQWTAAAAFTRERLEEIRQVKEEIAWLKMITPSEQTWKSCTWMTSDRAFDYGVFGARGNRILAREQSALAELVRGIKPEALA